MIGATTVTAAYSSLSLQPFQLNARLYDVFPDNRAVMVDRGVKVVPLGGSSVTYQLHGNGWRFPAGHRVRIEIAQDDAPYIKFSSVPSLTQLSGVQLDIPVREAGVVTDPEADLSITKSDSVDPATQNQPFDYTLIATNNDADDTTENTQLTDDLPAGVTLNSATAPPGDTCTPGPGTIDCDLGI